MAQTPKPRRHADDPPINHNPGELTMQISLNLPRALNERLHLAAEGQGITAAALARAFIQGGCDTLHAIHARQLMTRQNR